MNQTNCPSCKEDVELGNNVCYNCGAHIYKNPAVYNEKDRFKQLISKFHSITFNDVYSKPQKISKLLILLIIINYIGTAFLLLLGALMMHDLSSTFIIIILGILFGILNFRIQKYDNPSRLILIGVLFVLSILTFITLNLLILGLALFELYILLLDEKSVRLFEQNPIIDNKKAKNIYDRFRFT